MASLEEARTDDQTAQLASVHDIILQLQHRIDPVFYYNIYSLALKGLDILEKPQQQDHTPSLQPTLLEQFQVLLKHLGSLPLAVAFTCHVFKTFGYTNLSELEQYALSDFNMAAYPKVDLRLTVTLFFYKLNKAHQRPSALSYVSSVHLDGYNYKAISIPDYVQVMCDRNVIQVGDISALDHPVQLYRPSFFNKYLERSKSVSEAPVSRPPIVIDGEIATAETEEEDTGNSEMVTPNNSNNEQQPLVTLPSGTDSTCTDTTSIKPDFNLILDKTPKIYHALELLKPLKNRWKALSYSLGVIPCPSCTGDDIADLGAVLEAWLHGDDRTRTWGHLRNALSNVMDESEMVCNFIEFLEHPDIFKMYINEK